MRSFSVWSHHQKPFPLKIIGVTHFVLMSLNGSDELHTYGNSSEAGYFVLQFYVVSVTSWRESF